MTKRPVLIVDIDGTLLSQNLRRRKILQELFDIEIDINCTDLEAETVFERLLQKLINSKKVALKKWTREDIQKRYYQLLFSNKYYEPCYFTVIENANEIMSDLSKYLDIYYLSARNKSLYEATIWQLNEFNFPSVGERNQLIILDRDVLPTDYRNFRWLSFEFKRKNIQFICNQRKVLAGIGDIIEDICAFNESNVIGILYANNLKEEDVEKKFKEILIPYDSRIVKIFGSWKKIEQYVKKLMSLNLK